MKSLTLAQWLVVWLPAFAGSYGSGYVGLAAERLGLSEPHVSAVMLLYLAMVLGSAVRWHFYFGGQP